MRSCVWEPACGEDGLRGLGMLGTKLEGAQQHSLARRSLRCATRCTGAFQGELKRRHKAGRATTATKRGTNTSRQKCKRS